MSMIYDNWEKLVGAVVKREELKRLAYCESFSSSSYSADFSFTSALDDVPTALQGYRISGKTSHGAPHSSHCVQPMRLKEIKKATKNFHPYLWLGQGAFGPVYKGWINENTLSASKPGSGVAVAVKKGTLYSTRGHAEWRKEIDYLSQLHHPNLVKLIGLCSEEDNLILVYEFMPRGSLDNHLFRRGHQSLSWTKRIKVALGAARALSFLHDMETPVIHRGCQCSNILLDGEFNGKLSAFGLARDGPTGDMTYVSTRVVSTYNNIAPEYATTGLLTVKCDVYSFGVVLLELLSGRKVCDTKQFVKEHDLVDWARSYLGDERKIMGVMDTRLEGEYPYNGAHAVLMLACQCLSTVPKERPRMSEVVAALEQLYHQ